MSLPVPYVALSRVADEARVSLGGLSPFAAKVRPDNNYPAMFSRITKWSSKP